MSRQSNVMRTALTIAASLLMSSVAVGSAVGPATAVTVQSEAPANA